MGVGAALLGRLPVVAFGAASLVAVAALVFVRTSDGPAEKTDSWDDLYQQSLDNPLIRGAPYTEHPEWFQRGEVPDTFVDDTSESSILEQLLRGLWP